MRKILVSTTRFWSVVFLAYCTAAAPAWSAGRILTAPIVEAQRVTLEGNTPPAALDAANDRGP